MRARLIAAAAAGAAALIALGGCASGSGSSGGSSNASGPVTLKFYGADYGTGPASSTTKYWDSVAAAFHRARPRTTRTRPASTGS